MVKTRKELPPLISRPFAFPVLLSVLPSTRVRAFLFPSHFSFFVIIFRTLVLNKQSKLLNFSYWISGDSWNLQRINLSFPYLSCFLFLLQKWWTDSDCLSSLFFFFPKLFICCFFFFFVSRYLLLFCSRYDFLHLLSI